MRELERESPDTTRTPSPALPDSLLIVGSGRVGRSFHARAVATGLKAVVEGRDAEPAEHDAVLLCVPDSAIAEACEQLAPRLDPGAAIGHVSGATTLDALNAAASRGHAAFSLHPLQTVPGPETDLNGAPCAIAGTDSSVLRLAESLATHLGMRPFEVPEDRRAAYHAAASIASNFLVALEESAADLLERAGVGDGREILAPLVLRSAANWADTGRDALTGPIARGDEATIERHLEALRETAPELLPMYQVLAERTRETAGGAS